MWEALGSISTIENKTKIKDMPEIWALLGCFPEK
jgi:hypothetical protein